MSEHAAGGPSPLLIVSAVVGLPVALWLYKCFMMVLFQRKLIYMNYVPLGARTEQVRPDDPMLKGLHYEQISISSTDNVQLQGLLLRRERDQAKDRPPDAVVIYLQGNAGNPIHRIPLFRVLLEQEASTDLAILALAPRSYWLSTSKTATEAGILADYLCVLRHTQQRYPHSPMILYGHSLGGSVATCLLSQLPAEEGKQVKGLVIENAFSSIPDMVRALYSSPYNPYHYLAPFAWDKWEALGALQNARECSTLSQVRLCVMSSGRDELVPISMGERMYRAAADGGKIKVVERVVIDKALHEDAWRRVQWGKEVVGFIRRTCELYPESKKR